MEEPRPEEGGEEQPRTELSPDGDWWWDGERWVPALSPDGLWLWDGSAWQLAGELDTGDPVALVEGLDRLVDDRFAEGGRLLALRAHEWRPRDPELAGLVARAAPLAARLAELDAQLSSLASGGALLSIRHLLGGDERGPLEAQAREVESELRPLVGLIGRMAPQPSLRDADEVIVPARRLAERVVELSEAVAEERRLAAEHEERLAAARRRLEEARAERENALRELSEQLRAREGERKRALDELNRALRRVRIPVPGAALGGYEGVVLYENRLDTPDGRGPLEGAAARVGTAAELWASDRETIDQLGLLEAAHAGRFHDALANAGDGETYLLMKTSHVRSLVPVPAGTEEEARAFAADLMRAAGRAHERQAEWQTGVAAAEAALEAAIADTRDVDGARAGLEKAESDPDLKRPIEEAEAEVHAASARRPDHEAARSRVDAIAERLLQPPPPLR